MYNNPDKSSAVPQCRNQMSLSEGSQRCSLPLTTKGVVSDYSFSQSANHSPQQKLNCNQTNATTVTKP